MFFSHCAYCHARKRLPEELFAHIARGIGSAFRQASLPQWLWRNRNVYMFDGTTISLPDTPSNQGLIDSRINKPGSGLSAGPCGGIFSLSCGAILDLAVAGHSGKCQGEVTLFRQL